jgi:hypothetical protein
LPVALPYTWTQVLGEVDLVVPVPKGTRARDLSVVIQKKKLSVGFKGQEPILAGELCKEIKVDDSTWNLGEHRMLISISHSPEVMLRGPIFDHGSPGETQSADMVGERLDTSPQDRHDKDHS